MPAPLQVGHHVKARVGPLVEHTKPDGTKAKRRQKSFMTGRIVAAKGPSLFSVRFENGRAGDHGSNTLVFVADPQFASPPGSLPLQQRQVPTALPPSLITVQQPQVTTTLPPSLIAVPTHAQAAARAPPSLEETITKEALAGTMPTVAVPAAAQAAARAPQLLEETIAD
jgi:hypothetical protein